MFWKRRPPAETPASAPAQTPRPAQTRPAETVSDAEELQRSLDAVAELLRATGRFALDLPELPAAEAASVGEQWAQHLLVRARRPNDPVGEGPGPTRRDFAGAVRFGTDLLRDGHDHHEQTLDDFRRAIWEFVHGLHVALSADEESDTRVKGELLRVQAAAEHGSPDLLKREVASVVDNIGHLLEERRERQRTQSAELAARVSALGRELEVAKREGSMDGLTQIYNRRAFDEHLEKAAALYALVDQPISLVLIDVDHFKSVNDSYGHATGDEVLRRVAACLVKTFLRRDDFIARYGGEEFAVVLRDTRLAESSMVVERLLRKVRELELSHEGTRFSVTVSAGVAQFAAGDSVKDWIERTDRALYAAKHGGRDRLCQAQD